MRKFGTNIKNCLIDLRTDCTGNFALISAVTLMMIVLGVGAAYDYNSMIGTKSRLQDSVDLAALAGASIAKTNTPQMQRR